MLVIDKESKDGSTILRKKGIDKERRYIIKTTDISSKGKKEEGSFSEAAVNEPACLCDWLQE